MSADAVTMIAIERERQQSQEGWTLEHDDQHSTGDLARAAAAYALGDWCLEPDLSFYGEDDGTPHQILVCDIRVRVRVWPWYMDWWKPSPDDRIRELVKAGALIVAEIERLQRAAAPTDPEQGGE